MPIATAQMNSKQFETRNFVFSPEIWIQDIQEHAMKPHSQKSVLFAQQLRRTLRLPWRSTAEARPGAGGARGLRRGRAAAAPRPGGLGAPAGPRAPLDAHRGEQLGGGAAAAGEVQRGAAACCEQSRSCCILWWEKFGKNGRETINAFSDHLISEIIIHIEVR